MSRTFNKTAMLRRIEKLFANVRSSASTKPQPPPGVDRRDFLRMGALAGTAAASFGSLAAAAPAAAALDQAQRSEERRVGKECRSRWGLGSWKNEVTATASWQ